MFPVAFQYHVIRRWTEIPAFVNGYLAVFERFRGMWCLSVNSGKLSSSLALSYCTGNYALGGTKGFKNGCEVTLKIIRLCMIPIIVQNTVQILKAPSSKIFFTSLMPDEYIRQLAYRLPLMMIQWEIWMGVISCAILFIPLLYLYAFPTVFMPKEMVS